jgi:hypothetical protein
MSVDQNRALYLDLLKRSVLNVIYAPSGMLTLYGGRQMPALEAHLEGQASWFGNAHSMLGMKRLDNIQTCMEAIIAEQIPGDLIETGVWQGGATIFMRGILKSYGITDRIVWVADSFEGLPPANPEKYPDDRGMNLSQVPELAVSLEQVRSNFERYDLLDDQVRFLKGWFKDTLPSAPIEKLALLRLDGDMYESTMDGLISLYHKVSTGGFVIIDDYGTYPACAKAVHDFLDSNNLHVELQPIDADGVYWKKPAA